MKIAVDLEVEPLSWDRMVAFHTPIGTAAYGGREFEVCRSLTGLQLLFMEKVGDGLVTHTVDLSPVVATALGAIVAGAS